jgi:hypothetical protein
MNGTEARLHPRLILLSIAAITFLGMSCMNPGGTEVENEKTITVYLSDGKTPAPGARVAIFQSNDTTHFPVFTTVTNSRGQYTVDSTRFQNGFYNVSSRLEELASLQDSVLIINNTASIANDTLRKTRSISGWAALQPNHNLLTVTVHAVGTNSRVNVDTRGFFTLEDLALGKYTLMLVSTRDDYTPLYYRLIVTGSSPDTIPDTLRLPYTGIPIITGLSAVYDTLHGIVKVWWRPTSYFDFQRYNVYRTDADSISWPAKPLFIPQDTCIFDTLTFRNDTIVPDTFGGSHIVPATIRSLKYRVTVVDNTDREGLPYKYVRIDAVAPSQATKITDYTSFVPLPRHGLCTLKVSPGIWYGNVQKVEWDFGNTGSFHSSAGYDTVFSVPEDSIITGYPCVVRITGVQNRTGSDTLLLRTQIRPAMIAKLPFVSDTANTPIAHSAVVFQDRLFLFCQQWPSWSTKILSSSDGITWQKEPDSIAFGSIKSPVACRRKLFVLNPHSPDFLLVSENGSSFKPVSGPPLDSIFMIDTIGNTCFLTSNDSILYFNSMFGVWACDSTSVWKKAASEVPQALLAPYNYQFNLNGSTMVFGSGYTWSAAEFFKTTDFISYTRFSEYQSANTVTYNPLPLICGDNHVMMIEATGFNPSRCSILYSTDAVSWKKIGETDDSIGEAVHFNGKDLLFSSNGTVYELK